MVKYNNSMVRIYVLICLTYRDFNIYFEIKIHQLYFIWIILCKTYRRKVSTITIIDRALINDFHKEMYLQEVLAMEELSNTCGSPDHSHHKTITDPIKDNNKLQIIITKIVVHI